MSSVQVGVADAARRDIDQNFAGSGNRHRHLAKREWLSELFDDGGLHSSVHVGSPSIRFENSAAPRHLTWNDGSTAFDASR
jgi:hypothetical protein